MKKQVNTKISIHPLIKNRWSPRAFDNKAVEEEKIINIIESARWAPSAYNEQPWRFIIGKSGDENYLKIFDSLVEWNQKWVKNVPLLILNITKKKFSHNNKINATALYDLGQSVAFMVLEAENQGLACHQMSGFDHEKIIVTFEIPEDFEPVSITAIGYQGDISTLPEDFISLEKADRKRKPARELLFNSSFENKK